MLVQLFDHLRPGDALLVWRLARLGRSVRHLINLVGELRERHVGLRSLQEGIDKAQRHAPTPGPEIGSFSPSALMV